MIRIGRWKQLASCGLVYENTSGMPVVIGLLREDVGSGVAEKSLHEAEFEYGIWLVFSDKWRPADGGANLEIQRAVSLTDKQPTHRFRAHHETNGEIMGTLVVDVSSKDPLTACSWTKNEWYSKGSLYENGGFWRMENGVWVNRNRKKMDNSYTNVRMREIDHARKRTE